MSDKSPGKEENPTQKSQHNSVFIPENVASSSELGDSRSFAYPPDITRCGHSSLEIQSETFSDKGNEYSSSEHVQSSTNKNEYSVQRKGLIETLYSADELKNKKPKISLFPESSEEQQTYLYRSRLQLSDFQLTTVEKSSNRSTSSLNINTPLIDIPEDETEELSNENLDLCGEYKPVTKFSICKLEHTQESKCGEYSLGIKKEEKSQKFYGVYEIHEVVDEFERTYKAMKVHHSANTDQENDEKISSCRQLSLNPSSPSELNKKSRSCTPSSEKDLNRISPGYKSQIHSPLLKSREKSPNSYKFLDPSDPKYSTKVFIRSSSPNSPYINYSVRSISSSKESLLSNISTDDGLYREWVPTRGYQCSKGEDDESLIVDSEHYQKRISKVKGKKELAMVIE